ncbi:KilA-N domain-containing protein [Acetobacter sicerae]|uniref:KilA-N domain-containing protein n=1 Tax=Acetobacter sicerae TaxID=85325 RepID=UPI00156B4AE4|nr:KilA-N domain-containing protein [Acetobacter sicerae]NHN93902.1 hypothetical protein [Acetobacter sicerae]
MNNLPHTSSLTILNMKIRQDAEGRYSLNDCHRAAGGDPNKAPSEWTKNDQTTALIEELEVSGNSPTPLNIVKTGPNDGRGTYVAKELVYAYAMWISPAFHLAVIRAFDAMVMGRVPAPKRKRVRTTAVDVAFRRCKNIADMLPNFDENQRLLMAARGAYKLSGTNPLELLDVTSIAAPTQDNYMTPTELGKPLGLSAVIVNRQLRDADLQIHTPGTSGGSDWTATEAGKECSRMFDATRKGGHGSQQVLRWSEAARRFLTAKASGKAA